MKTPRLVLVACVAALLPGQLMGCNGGGTASGRDAASTTGSGGAVLGPGSTGGTGGTTPVGSGGGPGQIGGGRGGSAVATGGTAGNPGNGNPGGGGGGGTGNAPAGGAGGLGTGGGAVGDAGSVSPADGGASDVTAGGSTDAAVVKRYSCPAGPFPAPAPGTSQMLCASFKFNYSFNEGPTWVAAQNAFFFSNFISHDPTQGDMIKYTPGGDCEMFLPDVGCNGLAVTPDGNLVGACHRTRSIVRFDLTTKKSTTVADMYMGKMFDSPNDVVVHSNGTIYFTNPNAELGNRPPGVGLAVFRIDPAGMVSLLAMSACNGIGLSPDEKRLYVLQAGLWDLDPQGLPSNRINLFTGGDGMAVDCAGNVYASGTIFSAQGTRLGSYGAGTNLAFGGADGKTLFIVGGGGGASNATQVRSVQMNLPGLP